jgi:hypothetical protein
LASSLFLCNAFLGVYEKMGDLTAVRMVFGSAILLSLGIAFPLSALATLKVPAVITKETHEGPVGA